MDRAERLEPVRDPIRRSSRVAWGRPSRLITHRYTIDRHAEALNVLAAAGGGPRGKILFDMKAGD